MIEFKIIKGFDDYLVSNYGGIISCKNGRKFERKAVKDTKGYMRVCLCMGGVMATRKIHREVAIAFIPNPENKSEVNHINGIKSDNRVENLEWVSHLDNMRHASKEMLLKHGSKSSFSKLTELDIPNIRNKFNIGISQRSIAKEYKVSHTTIKHIINGDKWKHVQKIV